MRLTQHTDYALRVLIHVGLKRGEASTIREISESYGVSRNHLMKVANTLGRLGFVVPTRGRGGGLVLARGPAEINIGDVVRDMEENLTLVECFRSADNTCPIAGICRLERVLAQALKSFLAVLDGVTLADLLSDGGALRLRLGIGGPVTSS
ncbi:Rrf2 family transcriptional regulator [Iodidimonas sp. SYSU 1G8]|uniref:Rrf2 family transcriptional regulator n=1 Tax=Iodidimonas sp. SYSU 1G8 TaxID=3133967 RepID=UPI0031FE86BD